MQGFPTASSATFLPSPLPGSFGPASYYLDLLPPVQDDKRRSPVIGCDFFKVCSPPTGKDRKKQKHPNSNNQFGVDGHKSGVLFIFALFQGIAKHNLYNL
jgi:hypothetical protein